MEIDNKRIEKILQDLESALGKISRIDSWLPRAIENAIPPNLRGISDPLNIEKMRKDKKDEEKHETEMESLRTQIEESQRQTGELKKQSRYLFWAFIIAFLGFIFNAIVQISPNLFGLIKYFSSIIAK